MSQSIPRNSTFNWAAMCDSFIPDSLALQVDQPQTAIEASATPIDHDVDATSRSIIVAAMRLSSRKAQPKRPAKRFLGREWHDRH
jgi:hypothetical protein